MPIEKTEKQDQDQRIFYIQVGNIDPDDIQTYMAEIVNRFKTKEKIEIS